MKQLSVLESAEMLKKADIPFVQSTFIREKGEFSKMREFTEARAMKIVSREIVHKSDQGGLALNLRSKQEALEAFERMARLPGFEGVLLQEQREGVEVIIGGKQDPQFGPVVLVGMGGVLAEVLKDSSIRLAPVSRQEARKMLEELRGYRLLAGYRQQKPINIESVIRLVVRMSAFMEKNREVLEVDLNPVLCTAKEAVPVDARVVIA